MHTPALGTLRETADQLSLLAGLLQIPGRSQRAQSIRRADKALVVLESFFTSSLAENARKWSDATQGLVVLRDKLTQVDALRAEMDQSKQRIDESRNSMEKWLALPDHERLRFLHEARQAKTYLENQSFRAEAHILHRYERFAALKGLAPFADNAEHLCEAIFHFENRAKYELNITKLEQKREQAQERMKSVRRGFILSLVFCLFIVTIPLCAPFAISLWARRREIETQIANINESRRREERRLQAADEGVVASDTIREILGNVPLDQIRRTLAEVRELRLEFQKPDKNTSSTAKLLSFLELNQIALRSLFGEMPADRIEAIRWFLEHVTQAQNIEKKIKAESDDLEVLRQKLQSLTRGYSRDILCASISNLENLRTASFAFPFDEDLKRTFAGLCRSLPGTLLEVRKILWHITHAQSVADEDWFHVQRDIQAHSNTLSACVAILDVESVWGGTEIEEKDAAIG